MKMWLATERCKLFIKNFEMNKPEYIKYKDIEEKKRKEAKKQFEKNKRLAKSMPQTSPVLAKSPTIKS